MPTIEEVKRRAIESGIDNFSDNYIEGLVQKDSYTKEDMRDAFKAGARWMRDFSAVADIIDKSGWL
jgi:hypothetical protein